MISKSYFVHAPFKDHSYHKSLEGKLYCLVALSKLKRLISKAVPKLNWRNKNEKHQLAQTKSLMGNVS